MTLGKINKEDLLFYHTIDEDRVCTFLSLDDYDWMNYTLSTKLKTELYGTLEIKFNYFGCTTSSMKVTQNKDGAYNDYEVSFPTEVFQKHIIIFLNHHIAAWDSHYAFNGEDEVLDFYNEVIGYNEN